MGITLNGIYFDFTNRTDFQEITQELQLRGAFSGGKKIELSEQDCNDMIQHIFESAYEGGMDDEDGCSSCGECNNGDHSGYDSMNDQLSAARTLLSKFEEAPEDWEEFKKEMKEALCDE